VNLTGDALEAQWLDAGGRVPRVESLPSADLIVVLSGGVGSATNVSPYAELYSSADRVWHAARLYKAGKASKIVLTGLDSRDSSIPLLKDFGVPESAILVDNDSKNTEQNAKFTVELLKRADATSASLPGERGTMRLCEPGDDAIGSIASTREGRALSRPNGEKRKVLLVTSAFHMRRSVLMFHKYAPELEVVPAPSDFEMTVVMSGGWESSWLLPSAGSLERNGMHLKEFIGYWGYRLLR